MNEYSGNKYLIIAKVGFGQSYLDNYLGNDRGNHGNVLICTMHVESIVMFTRNACIIHFW